MLAKTKYNIGEIVTVRKNDDDYICQITDITIYIQSKPKSRYITYLCCDVDNFKNIVVTEKDITRHIKLYKIRKWLSKVFYNLYLRCDKLWW